MNQFKGIPQEIPYLATWLNAAATISLVTKIDAATIQGRLLLEGGVYCTKLLLHVATTQTYFKFEEVPGLLCHNVYTLKPNT